MSNKLCAISTAPNEPIKKTYVVTDLSWCAFNYELACRARVPRHGSKLILPIVNSIHFRVINFESFVSTRITAYVHKNYLLIVPPRNNNLAISTVPAKAE